jgi:hypothetical protein
MFAFMVAERVVHGDQDGLVLVDELLEDETDELEADLAHAPDGDSEEAMEARVVLVTWADGARGTQHAGHRMPAQAQYQSPPSDDGRCRTRAR